MEPFTTLTAIGIPFDRVNVDTDQIIPARFLRKQRSDPDYPLFLFNNARYNEDGSEKPEFILNQEPYRRGQIVVSDENWGCGSSREAAVYALLANGIRAVVAPSFGDIHYNNGMKNGMLPVRLSISDCDTLRKQLNDDPGAEVTIELDEQIVTGPDGTTYTFEIDPLHKHCMLNGLDDISLTLEYEADITAYEEKRRETAPWLY
ncbi:MAG: 3-isopropylmalate dehydratase small subunit [Rhodospirillaceae bacterium]|nr:3-isopropylmalate dehydratase small subunit [Rhodospirillaceae bacterium]HAA94055.1 3-isopropylmalate dehydratase small subunit [Rhodospirillaceae bacterium]